MIGVGRQKECTDQEFSGPKVIVCRTVLSVAMGMVHTSEAKSQYLANNPNLDHFPALVKLGPKEMLLR